jgi:cell division septal protein FtsQ
MLQQIDKKYKWIGILFLFIALTTFNLSSSNFINIFFPIKVIEYNKTFFLTESTKSKVNNFLKNKSLIWINTKQAKNLFNRNIWVETAIFTKKFPNTLQISVLEYFPIAYFKKNKLIYLINSNFKNSLIDKNSNFENLIEVKNIKDLKNFKTFFSKIKNHDVFLSKIKIIDYIHDGRWDVVLKDGQLIKLGNYNLNKQVKYLNFILNNQTAKIIDLRYDGRVVIANE